VDGGGIGQAESHQGVAAFVISGALLFVGVHDALALFQTRDNPLDTLVELLHGNGGLVRPRGQQSGLIDQVGQVGANETGRDPRQFLQIDRRVELHLRGVNLQNVFAPADVGPIDRNVAVEPAGAQEGGVERFGSVGGRHHDDAAVGTEAVHFDQQGVEGLFTFVVSTDDTAAARLA